jgi:3-deoxy-D-manno-octulosonic-acid transferase
MELLQQQGIGPCSISGDTRFDRVLAIKQNHTPIPLVEQFAGVSQVLVAGSTWPGDEALLQPLQHHIKMVIAPHEITPAHIASLQNTFPQNTLFSEALNGRKTVADAGILIIDNIGMLSRLYQYGAIAYVGGGFTASGIHNTLEAAVWGRPVIFGPNYHKFLEAKGLIAAGGGFSINNEAELVQVINNLLHNKAALEAASHAAAQYVLENSGATQRIVRYIQENRLLTR